MEAVRCVLEDNGFKLPAVPATTILEAAECFLNGKQKTSPHRDICAGNSRSTQGVHSFWWEEPPRSKRKDVGQIVQVKNI